MRLWIDTEFNGYQGELISVARAHLQAALEQWLRRYSAIHVVADWPDDIAHFCQLLITGPGQRIATPPLTLEVRRDIDGVSNQPHNALADARAIKDAHLAIERVPS